MSHDKALYKSMSSLLTLLLQSECKTCYVSWNLVNCSTNESHLIKRPSWTQLPLYDLLLVICSNNIAISHRFQDITNFAMYMTAPDLESASSFNCLVKTEVFQFQQGSWNYKQNVMSDSHVTHIIANTCRISRGTGDNELSNSKATATGAIQHMVFHCNHICILYRLQDVFR